MTCVKGNIWAFVSMEEKCLLPQMHLHSYGQGKMEKVLKIISENSAYWLMCSDIVHQCRHLEHHTIVHGRGDISISGHFSHWRCQSCASKKSQSGKWILPKDQCQASLVRIYLHKTYFFKFNLNLPPQDGNFQCPQIFEM